MSLFKASCAYRQDLIFSFEIHDSDPDGEYCIQIIDYSDNKIFMHLTRDQLKDLSNAIRKELGETECNQ
jgi:hypothetical protein